MAPKRPSKHSSPYGACNSGAAARSHSITRCVSHTFVTAKFSILWCNKLVQLCDLKFISSNHGKYPIGYFVGTVLCCDLRPRRTSKDSNAYVGLM